MRVRRMFAAVGTSSGVVSSGLLAWQVGFDQIDSVRNGRNGRNAKNVENVKNGRNGRWVSTKFGLRNGNHGRWVVPSKIRLIWCEMGRWFNHRWFNNN